MTIEAVMTMFPNAVVWLDQYEAKIIHFDAETSAADLSHPAQLTRHLHARSSTDSETQAAEEASFYDDVAKALEQAKAVFLTGPSTAKTEFVKDCGVACRKPMG
jgi:hypothetical protein